MDTKPQILLENADIVDAVIEAVGTSRTELLQNIRKPEQMLALLRARLRAMRDAS